MADVLYSTILVDITISPTTIPVLDFTSAILGEVALKKEIRVQAGKDDEIGALGLTSLMSLIKPLRAQHQVFLEELVTSIIFTCIRTTTGLAHKHH